MVAVNLLVFVLLLIAVEKLGLEAVLDFQDEELLVFRHHGPLPVQEYSQERPPE